MHDLEQTDMLQPLVNEIETTVSKVEYATYGMDSNLFVQNTEYISLSVRNLKN